VVLHPPIENRDSIISDAAQALEVLGDPCAVQPLLKAFSYRLDRLNRKSVLRAITKLAVTNPEPVVAALQDPEADIRHGAAEVLTEIGGETAVEPLLKTMEDRDEAIRDAARTALKRIRKRGVAVRIPGKPFRERISRLLASLMEFYFAIPSTSGFSPYRTGASVHAMFSILLAGSIWLLMSRFLEPHWAINSCASLAGVFLLWGVGVWIGIASHYNPLLTLIAIGGLIAGVFVFRKEALIPGAIGIVSHFGAYLFVTLLQKLYRASGNETPPR
jgi:hypothetical protein